MTLEAVTLTPATIEDVKVDDVVFVRWKGNYLLHLAKAVEPGRVLIGNNIGKINGWVQASDVLGKQATHPEPAVLWRKDVTVSLADAQDFCRSMHHWEMSFNLSEEFAGTQVRINGLHVSLEKPRDEVAPNAFHCPNCAAPEFMVVYGELDDKVVLGLGCLACETGGIVAPHGL